MTGRVVVVGRILTSLVPGLGCDAGDEANNQKQFCGCEHDDGDDDERISSEVTELLRKTGPGCGQRSLYIALNGPRRAEPNCPDTVEKLTRLKHCSKGKWNQYHLSQTFPFC